MIRTRIRNQESNPQKQQLQKSARQTEAMIRAVDAALAVLDGDAGRESEGTTMDMKQLFDGFDPAEYEREAEQRWGDTDAYKQSIERTKRYSADDWKRLAAEQTAVYADLATAMKEGKPPSDDEVLRIVERHRLLIDRWFYPCSRAMQIGLAGLYENDPRFAANIDKYGEGLTGFLVEAIKENARRGGE